MSGHNKWSTIKHKKTAQDAKRGQIFTKLIKEITIAARNGGGNPDNNPRLRIALASAKAANMPKDNIERAIKKGTGELEGVNYEEAIYEGYGPAGVAIMIEIVSDNKNRTVSELRHILSRHGGNLGADGCVAWMFDQKGVITIDKSRYDEETLMSIALDAGAEDFKEDEGYFIITTDPKDFEKVKNILDEKKISYEHSEISRIPKTTVKLEPEDARKVLKLIDLLEEHDDVQHVYFNADIDSKVMEEIAG